MQSLSSFYVKQMVVYLGATYFDAADTMYIKFSVLSYGRVPVDVGLQYKSQASRLVLIMSLI